MFGLIYEGFNRVVFGKRKKFSTLMLRDIIAFDRKNLNKVETIYSRNIPVYYGTDYEEIIFKVGNIKSKLRLDLSILENCKIIEQNFTDKKKLEIENEKIDIEDIKRKKGKFILETSPPSANL